MKNWEKYEEEIKAVDYSLAVVNGKATQCIDTACSDCKFDHDGIDCEATMMKWLYEEADENWIEEGLRELETLMQRTTEQLEREYNPTKIFDTSDGKLQGIDFDSEFTMQDIAERINEIVDAMNELKGEQK